MILGIQKQFPQTKLFATTLREVVSANLHKWGAICLEGDNLYKIEPREIGVLDRIGGGDGFVGGLLYGGDPYLLLADFDDYAATHERLYAAIADPAARARLSLVNIARSGIFAADPAVREYAERIWEVHA